MEHSPEIGQGCHEGAVVSVEAMVVMKEYESHKDHGAEDVEPSLCSCWEPGFPGCEGKGGREHGERLKDAG